MQAISLASFSLFKKNISPVAENPSGEISTIASKSRVRLMEDISIFLRSPVLQKLTPLWIPIGFASTKLPLMIFILEKFIDVSGNLVEKSDEKDANSMQAVGSAWARVGDKVKSIYGVGVVTDMRGNGEAVIEMQSWELAGGQKPTAYLQKGAYEKVF